jgi:hypothetical protein
MLRILSAGEVGWFVYIPMADLSLYTLVLSTDVPQFDLRSGMRVFQRCKGYGHVAGFET